MDVRIEKLEPMRVAYVCVVGQNPEEKAWNILRDWAYSKEPVKEPEKHPVFGFNNPSPSPGQDEYGYEFWMKIGPGEEPEGEVKTKEFPGGTYAVTTVQGFPSPDIWIQLWEWVKASQYRWRQTHELEWPHNFFAEGSELKFDLYLPIEEVM